MNRKINDTKLQTEKTGDKKVVEQRKKINKCKEDKNEKNRTHSNRFLFFFLVDFIRSFQFSCED